MRLDAGGIHMTMAKSRVMDECGGFVCLDSGIYSLHVQTLACITTRRPASQPASNIDISIS